MIDWERIKSLDTQQKNNDKKGNPYLLNKSANLTRHARIFAQPVLADAQMMGCPLPKGPLLTSLGIPQERPFISR